MNALRRTRRAIVAAAAAGLALSPLSPLAPLGGLGAADAAVPVATHGIDFDYFDDVYPNAGEDSVFETVTLERFKYILRDKPGNFAFFIGDPNDENAQATIGYINQVAKQQGITKIYNFTPKIDGGKWNLWNWNDLASVTGGNALTYWKNEGPTGGAAGNPGSYYTTHTDDYLNKDTTPEFVRTDGVINGPYLFVYNKDRQVDVAGTPTDDHIVSSLSDRKTASDLDTSTEVNAYKSEVADVLDAVPAADYATNTAFQFWKDEANRRHNSTYADANLYGGDILEDSDNADGWRVQPITYPEWIDLLKQSGDVPFLFGGTWCHNTRAIVKYVNKFAQQYGVKKVYNFDYSLFSTSNGGTNYDHSRSSGQTITTGTGTDTRLLYPSQVYGQTVNSYLTNAIAEYGKVGQTGASPNYYYPDGDVTQPVANAVRIQVGHVLTYNKDHVDAAGNPAPVVDQALRQNDNGGNTEYMTEWSYVKGKDLPVSDSSYRGSSQAGSNALANQRAFAKEGIDDIEQVFRGYADDLPSTTTVTGVDPQVVKGTAVTLSVAVDAADFTPFVSVNGAGGSAAPGTLTAKPRGWVRLLDAAGHEVARSRVTRAGATSFVLGAQSTLGAQSYTVQYLGRGDLIAKSSKAVSFEVVKPATTTALSAPSSIAAGSPSELTATVTPSTATGTVTLTGLPGDPITGTLSGGTAALTVPGTVASGSYQVKAVYAGDADNAASEGNEQSLQVVANASTTTLAGTTTTAYGDGGTLTATVTDGATGTVTLHGLPDPVDAEIVDHVATFTIPSTVPVGSYQLHAQYLGNSQYGASQSGSRELTVTKKSTTTSLTGSSPLALGAGGTVTVHVPGGTGTVTLSGLPGGGVDATLASGSAAFTVPKSLPAGSYSLSATYGGDSSHTGSDSSHLALAVSKGAARLAVSAPAKAYGAAGTVSVTLDGVAGFTPTGTVRVSEGATVLATGSVSGGKATLALPKATSVKKHALTVEYAGSDDYTSSASPVTFTVTKGAAKAPIFKAKGTVSAKKAGTATVTVATTTGLAAPGGTVKLTLQRGGKVKTLTAKLGSKGTVVAKLPRLTAGTWSVKVTYLGNATYAAGKAKAFTLKVKK